MIPFGCAMSSPPRPVSNCEALVGKALSGELKKGSWRIIERLERSQDGSGGNFSVGYLAIHEDGTRSFCKATDIGLLTRCLIADPLTKMRQALNEQYFEREILTICRGNNLDRIVHALDYGQMELVENGVRDIVFYIMFELASGDVRQQVNRQKRLGLSWTFLALHNLAIAIQQLHRQRIAHNDVKPSNFLVFDEHLQKLADLGRATSETTNGPWDTVNYTGDHNYAAPEFWYRNNFPMQSGKIAFSVRQASDLYHLGSMAFFLVTGQRLTPLMHTFIRPEHNSHNWRGNYQEVLPFIRDSFGASMAFFDTNIPHRPDGSLIPEANDLKTAICQLCDPDPRLRGHPSNIQQSVDQYGLDRFVSQFDRGAKAMNVHYLAT